MHPLNGPQHARNTSLPEQAGSLATILREEFGVAFRIFGAADGISLFAENPASRGDELSREEQAWLVKFGADEQSCVIPSSGGSYRLALSIHREGRPGLVALGTKGSVARPTSDAIREESLRLEKWLKAVFDRLRFASQMERRHRDEAPKPAPASDPWEVVVRLEQLMRTQKIQKDPVKNRRRVLRSAAELVSVRSLIFVPTTPGDTVVTEGDSLLSPWDCNQLASLLSKSLDWEESGYLIINDMATTSWSMRFPQVANVLAFPVLDRIPVGWVMAINKQASRAQAKAGPARKEPGVDGPPGVDTGETAPFRRADAAVLAPFASLLGYHARASTTYTQLRELLVGLTRSLTAAIDAKDSYTYGHSERVARVAVELGRELGLKEDELSDIYLAGLLHDIGKIGIRDEVLGKRGPLDDAEFDHIKEHVKIGYRILSGLHSIAHLLPGVLYHHERYDGKGYPEGLKGNAIPFLARILAVADSYDAMSTSRPYRTAMPREKVEKILVEGAGTQWEKAIIDAFLRCKDRVNAVRQRGVGESLNGALDGALRRGGGRQPLSSMVSIVIN